MNEIDKALEAVDKIEADYILPDYQQKLSYSEVDALFKKIRAALEGMRWNFDMDAAPRDGTPFIALLHDGCFEKVYLDFVYTDNGSIEHVFRDWSTGDAYEPIAFIIPKPPAQEGEE